MTDVTATKIRVGGFEILKQNNSSAMENITILSPRLEEWRSINQLGEVSKYGMTYAHINSAHGRLNIIAIGSKPKIL